MKKLFTITFLLLIAQHLFAQNTAWSTSSNIGIGTTTPAALFSVKGSVANGIIRLTPSANNGEATIGFNTHSSETDLSSNWVIGSGPWTTSSSFAIGNTSFLAPSMTFLTNGNVLISKTSQANSGYKLDVNGSIRANAVIVNTSGADFVFASSYRLISLQKLKNYIDAHHHLPDIQSASAMQSNGVSLGEFQTKLLLKIEELTLYLFDKDQQLNEQNQVILKQQQEIAKQQIDSEHQLLVNKAIYEQIDQLRHELAADKYLSKRKRSASRTSHFSNK